MVPRWYSRQVHASWLVAAVCFGVCLGIFLVSIVDWRLHSPIWVFVVAILLMVTFWKRRVYLLVFALLAGSMIGIWRGGDYQDQLRPYDNLVGKTVTLQAKVTDDSDIGKDGELVLRLGDISLHDHSLTGGIWITSATKIEVKRGDIVTVQGKLAEGFGSFAASMYRAEILEAKRPIPGDVALRVRDWFSEATRQAIPEPEASLGVGYLVGQRRSLPEELDTALKATGLTHVVVASGYNLTILVNASRRLFAKVSKFLAAFFSGGLTIAFMAITGMSPSMSRAGLVTGLGLLAWYYGRKFHPVVLLLLAAAVTLLLNPAYGQNDLGWQLSFASFAGVLIMAPLIQGYFFGEAPPGVVRQVFFETMSAWVCTVPLIVLAFGQFSNVAILANVLVLPLVPLAMILTFVAGTISLLIPAIATISGLPALFVLGYMTTVTTYLGSLPWAQSVLEINWGILVLYYVVLVAVCGYTWHKTRFNFIDGQAKL